MKGEGKEQLTHKPLPCIETLMVALNKYRDRFETKTFELLQMIINGLNTHDQRMNFLRPMQNQEGFYLRDATAVRGKLEQKQYQRCSNESFPKVALCVVQHSTGPYVQEFIAHYLLLGVSKFIIYDNSKPGSPESVYFRQVVQPFVETGLVVVEDWYFDTGDRYRQTEASHQCQKPFKFRLGSLVRCG